jgi:hypothetical protein
MPGTTIERNTVGCGWVCRMCDCSGEDCDGTICHGFDAD